MDLGGVLLCGENFIAYRNIGHDEVRCAIPRRAGMSDDRGLLITAYAVYRQKAFFIVQVCVEPESSTKAICSSACLSFAPSILRANMVISTESPCSGQKSV